MSGISFQAIPQNLRLPLFFAEVNNSQANTNQQNQRALIIGQITAAGVALPNNPIICQGKDDAVAQCGAGSMLALMTAAYIKSDPFGEVWYLPLADASGSVAASGSILYEGEPTEAGNISLYIAGQRVMVSVSATDTSASLAASTVAAIMANTNLPVSATAVDGVVTLTALNKGQAGNDIDLRINYGGTVAGEKTPAGIKITLTAMSGGAMNPDLTQALANLGDQPFDFIVCPYTDSVSLDALKQCLNDLTGRWSWEQQVYGHVFSACRGTLANLTTLGTGRNNQHETILGFNDSPSPNWIWAADLAGTAAMSLRADPGRPLQTLRLNSVLAPPLASRLEKTERNILLWDGISTFTVDQDGTVVLENIITTYQKNAFNQPDSSYLEVETMFLLMYILRDYASLVTSKYARMKLAKDGTRFAAGAAIVTPSIIQGDLIARNQWQEEQGYVQDSKAFAKALIVQINATNPNRVDVLLPSTLIDQLRQFCLLAQFRL